MPDNTEYIELNIGNMDGLLPLTKLWRVIYFKKITSGSGSTSETLRDKVFPDGELPAGYRVAAVQRIDKTTTQLVADGAEADQDDNDSGWVGSCNINAYQMPTQIAFVKTRGTDGSTARPKYIESTITFAIVPNGCIPTT